MWQLLFAAGLFLVCALDSAAADSGTLHVEVGGTAVLHPGPTVSGNINSATWKHGADKAAELYGGDVTCYRQFKGRCDLNTTTGELTIKDLTLSDSGFYSAEINLNKVNTVQLQVMTPVPKPSVSTQCDDAETYCTLTCEGNASVPESVKYRWKEGDEYSISSKELKITKENKEPEFSCEMKNPVSSSRSDPVQNPLITGNSSGIIIAVVVSILLVVFVAVAVIVIVVYCRRKGTWTAPGDGVQQNPRIHWEVAELPDNSQRLLGVSLWGVQSYQTIPRDTWRVVSGPETIDLLPKPENGDQQQPNGDVHNAQDPGASGSSASNPDTGEAGRAADEEEAGETTEPLLQSGGVHSPPDDGSPPVASSSGEDDLSTEKAETADQDQTCSPEITKNTTEENHEGPEQH